MIRIMQRVNLVGIAGIFLPTSVLAAGGGELQPIVIVADSRHLSRVMAFWANLYNESHLYFSLLTVILIPLIGVVLGIIADLVMHRIGIDLNSRDLSEHR